MPCPPLHLYSHAHTRPLIVRLRSIRHHNAVSRPRPLYNMPRGPATILSPADLAKLHGQDPHHPRLRLHRAAIKAIEYYAVDIRPLADIRYSHSTVPVRLRIICNHLNENYLIRANDIKLSPIGIWRLIHRRAFASSSLTIPSSHNALYVQTRHPTPTEAKSSTLLRRKPACHNQIGEDHKSIKNNTTIIVPPHESIMYLAKDLHHRAHGSLSVRDIPSRSIVLDLLNIDHDEITPNNAGLRAVLTKNSITVAYSSNGHIQSLDNKLRGGTSRLHHQLTSYMLSHIGQDPSRFIGMNGSSLRESSLNIRLRFGFGRVQKRSEKKVNWSVHLWKFMGWDMPTIKYKPFTSLPVSLRCDLICLFESARSFSCKHYERPFNNSLRTQVFSKKFNHLLGYPSAKFRFEYIDIATVTAGRR